eukprot:TRINITY_DN8135_c0_g1_i4.p1 TRINITY_DN8135_c0_g1~~TRINITY_DN8135_c0_g1_i4.p1  ORF type:complete len:488 (+),score=80.71 TRINITY_DN8135_c0_g1_i4:42-1466(+)
MGMKNVKWAKEEIRYLNWLTRSYCFLHNREPIDLSGEDWHQLSEMFPRRNEEQCRDKYKMINKLDIHKYPWLPEEDEELTRVVATMGKAAWSEVAKQLNGCLKSEVYRTGKQCRERWINYLDPTINRANWTRSDDLQMLSLVQTYGKKWSKIAKNLNNRTENSVKNRFNSLLKRFADQLCKEESFDAQLTILVEQIKLSPQEPERHDVVHGGSSPTRKKYRSPKIDIRRNESSSSRVVNFETQRPAFTNNIASTGIEVSNPRVVTTFDMEPEKTVQQRLPMSFQIKSMEQLNEPKPTDDLRVCLVNFTTSEVFTAFDQDQSKRLRNIASSMLATAESRRGTPASYDEVLQKISRIVPVPFLMYPSSAGILGSMGGQMNFPAPAAPPQKIVMTEVTEVNPPKLPTLALNLIGEGDQKPMEGPPEQDMTRKSLGDCNVFLPFNTFSDLFTPQNFQNPFCGWRNVNDFTPTNNLNKL